ncbi:MAG: FISUMP domain-containing protein [Bacteroidales bacterium]
MKTLLFRSIIFAALLFYGILICSCKKTMEGSSGNLGQDPLGPDRSLPYTYSDWMANIDDSRYLSELTIPGTHDAGADFHTSEQGDESQFTIAQDFCLSTQLMLGVRWFDVRLNDDGGIMTVYHGPYYLHKNFTDLIDEAIAFLNNHKTETVVFMIKQEHSTRGDDAFANGIWCGYLNPQLSYFWLWPPAIPQLGMVRGKIVIVRQFEGTHDYHMGSPLIWQDNTTGNIYSSDNNFYYYVQDHYSLMTVPTSTKIAQIEDCLSKAHTEPYPYRCYYLNFTSGERGVDAGQSLEHIASEINPVINNFLLSGNIWHNCGVVFVNFAGGSDDGTVPSDLVKTLVNLNIFSDSLKIGTQVWMNHNLRVTHYRNGDIIPQVQDPIAWSKLTTGAWCYYNNDQSHSVFDGMLYNWYTVQDPRGLAPAGWHVASNAEWTTLINYVGGAAVGGGNLKDAGTNHWMSPNTGGMNTVLFTATPAGWRGPGAGTFIACGMTGDWWSSTEYNSDNAMDQFIHYNNSTIYNENSTKKCGYSVRCVKDDKKY